jgi:nicotinate-nucleotide adenylyltransferase
MGGMFDPVHRGHILAAEAVLKALDLNELLLVPCKLPNHRNPATAQVQDRLNMLQLASGHNPQLRVDERECRRAGVSYTVDTLASLRAEYPDATLVLVTGADAFAGLLKWHRWRDLFEFAHMCVVERPALHVSPPAELTEELQQRRIDSAEQLFQCKQGRIFVYKLLDADVSSTQIRHMLQQSCDLSGKITPEVLNYIREKSLYHTAAAVTDKADIVQPIPEGVGKSSK